MERLFGLSVDELAARLEGASSAGETGGSPPAAPATETGLHPLSHNQRSLWFLHALEPESPAYNVPAAVRLRGPVDRAALEAAIRSLVRRHPALRTTFAVVRGEPRQRVEAADGPTVRHLQLTEEDARGWSRGRSPSASTRRPGVRSTWSRARSSGCTCSGAPPSSGCCCSRCTTSSPTSGAWGCWSTSWASSTAPTATGEREPDLPELPAAGLYTEWAAEQLRRLGGAEGEELWSYWSERLSGVLPTLELHTDRPRPRVQTDHGATCVQRLGSDLTERLEALGRARGATPFMTLAAGFEALLHRATGQEEVLVGTVTAGRTRARFARTVGYFVNPLVLRGRFGRSEEGFGRLLERIREDVLGAFAHQDYPFPLLVERLAPERDPGRSPLVQAMVIYQRATLSDGQDLTPFALGEPDAEAVLGGRRGDGRRRPDRRLPAARPGNRPVRRHPHGRAGGGRFRHLVRLQHRSVRPGDDRAPGPVARGPCLPPPRPIRSGRSPSCP